MINMYEIGTRVVRNQRRGTVLVATKANEIIYSVKWDDGLIANYCAYGIKLEHRVPLVSNFIVLKEMGFAVWSTGGGCEAFGLDLGLDEKNCDYMYVTAVDDPSLPEPFDTQVGVGIFDKEGNMYEESSKEISTYNLKSELLFYIAKHREKYNEA